jgi:putative tricarboxylic transport membrane protein
MAARHRERMKTLKRLRAGCAGAALLLTAAAAAALPPDPRCVVPAKAGGGFDLTCQLARQMLQGQATLQVQYAPGGIGALMFGTMARQGGADAATLVAFSSGSLLNLAQGRFGPYTENDVRWLAVVGTDYGVIAVRADSPYRSLADLAKALKKDPRSVAFAAGGTIGSQDWFKAALFAREAGVSHKTLRFVAFEGGGDALTALSGGHVDAIAGDAAEVSLHMARHGGIRVLAVLSEARLPGALAGVPTAKEQGFKVVWPIARGVYVGRGVPDDVVAGWTQALRRAIADKDFVDRQRAHGLYPLELTGEDLQRHIRNSMADFRRLAIEFELPKK